MRRGSPSLKLAITIDRDVYAKIVRAAKADHTSVSVWMTAAARRSLSANGKRSRRRGRPLPDRDKLLARFPKLTGDSGRFLEEDRS